MRPSRGHNRKTMCIARPSAACLSHVTSLRDQQNIVDIIYHTLVEQGEQLSKCSNFYSDLYLKPPFRVIRWNYFVSEKTKMLRKLTGERISTIQSSPKCDTPVFYHFLDQHNSGS